MYETVMVLFLGTAFAADCPEGTTASQLVEGSDRGAAAFGALDIVRMSQEIAAVDDALPCLTDVASPTQAAAVHRVHGLQRFVEAKSDKKEAARPYFDAAITAHPEFRFDDAVLPPAHALRTYYEGLRPEAPSAQLPAPAEGRLIVDGAVNGAYDPARPYLLQHVVDNDVRMTAWVGPGGQRPDYSLPAADPVDVETPVDRGSSSKKLPMAAVALGGAGVAVAGAGAGLWYGANYGYYANCPEGVCPGTFYDDKVKPQRTLGVALVGAGTATLTAGLVSYLTTR